MAARVGLAPTPNGLTGRRATLTLPGNGYLALPAGLAPASVRLEDECLVYFGHGSIGKWSARQDLHLRSLGPKPSALAATLRAGKWRIRRDSHPQPSRRQRVAPLIELRIRNGCRAEALDHECPSSRLMRRRRQPSAPTLWRAKAGGRCWNAPVVTSDSCLRHRIYRRAAGTPP